jgi:hypothetical protein
MYISVHIPKTAGTAFFNDLEFIFKQNLCCDYKEPYNLVDIYTPNLNQRYLRLVKKLQYSKRHRQSLKITDRCIHGHFPSGKYISHYPDAKFIAWFRDPVQRLVSHYHHWKRNPDMAHTVCRFLHQENLSLLEFAKLDVMQNLQSRYFEHKHLEKLWFAGITENYDSQIKKLYLQLGITTPNQNIDHNLNPEKDKNSKYELTNNEQIMILDYNQLDQSLYEKASLIS